MPSSDILKVIYALLPGFLTAWVFYGLTAHQKCGSFERVVQALIYTGIVQAIVVLIRGGLLILGRVYVIGVWTDDRAFVLSIVVAVLLGLVFARIANNDSFHRFLRDHKWLKRLRLDGITTRTSFPSEWFSAFHQDKRYIVLHLKGERRLYGWPCEWPDQPDSGHFVIMQPEWILADNTRAEVHKVERMVIPAKEVEMVEFVKFDHEVTASQHQLDEVESALVKLQHKESNDGKQPSRDDELSKQRR